MKLTIENIRGYMSKMRIGKEPVLVNNCEIGETNCIYKIDVGKKAYLFRSNAFKGLRRYHYYEFSLLKGIEGAFESPKAFLYDSKSFDEPISILEYVRGTPLGNNLKDRLDEVIEVINRLHSTNKESFKNFQFFGRSNNFCEFLESILQYESENIQDLKKFLGKKDISSKIQSRYDEDKKYLKFRKNELKNGVLFPTHLSVHGGNVIDTQKGLRLIDWQRGGLGDNSLEIYILTKKAGINLDSIKEKYKFWDNSIPEKIDIYNRIFKLFNLVWLGNRMRMCETNESLPKFIGEKSEFYKEKFYKGVEQI